MAPEGLVLTGQPTGATADKVRKDRVPCSRTKPVPATHFSTAAFFPRPRGPEFPLVKEASSWLWGLQVRTYLSRESVWLVQRARISTATPVLLMALLCRLQTKDEGRVLLVWLSQEGAV